jgi:hypothetical protein
VPNPVELDQGYAAIKGVPSPEKNTFDAILLTPRSNPKLGLEALAYLVPKPEATVHAQAALPTLL